LGLAACRQSRPGRPPLLVVVMGCCGARERNAAEAKQALMTEAPDILYEDEEIEYAFAYTRDEVYFTSLRILYKDKQGIFGTKIAWRSIPYNVIKAFSIETAGSFDFTSELKIHASAVEDVEVSFKSDSGIDLFRLQRMINRKLFHPTSNKGSKTGLEETAAFQAAMADDSLSKFLDLLCDDARAIDAKELEEQLRVCPPLLDEDETVQMAYRCGRDTTAITDKRLLVIDVKGWTGKRVEYMSYFWKCIRAWAVATPGYMLDRDAELRIWTNISGFKHSVFKQDLRKGVDTMAVQKLLTEKLLGADTAPKSRHAASRADTGAGWEAFFGDQRMIDAGEANARFHTTTPLLQGDEQVEMAFKGMRDMTLFTTKRLVLIDPKGFTGTKVQFTSIPWQTVQAFAVRSAGSWFDKDSEMMVWTDIYYEPGGDNGPTPGMSYIQQDFAKDKVDLAMIGRYLAERCAPLGKDAGKTLAPQKLNAKSEASGFEKFLQVLGSDYRQVDPNELDKLLHNDAPLMLPNEKVQMGFACGRDKFVFTTHRAMKIDAQGWSGSKVMYLSLPYVNCRGYSVESSGTWDMDAEMELFFKAPWFSRTGSFSLDFGKAYADIVAIQKFLSVQLIGAADGKSTVPQRLLPDAAPDMCNLFLNWLGNDHHQISAEEAEAKFKSDPEILLPDEKVDLAFKCGRDLVLFTTKRLLQVNVQGWSGKKVSFLSTAWKHIAAYSVENAGHFDLDATVKMEADSPGAEKTKMDIRSGQGDLMGCYKLLFQKVVAAKQVV